MAIQNILITSNLIHSFKPSNTMEIVSNSFFEILVSMINTVYVIPQIIIFVAASILISKKKEPSSVIIFIGSIIMLLNTLFYSTLLPLLLKFEIITYEFYTSSTHIFISIFGLLGHLCFAIGLLLLVMSYVNNTLKNR